MTEGGKRCLCGRRIVRDRTGRVYDQCGTCRRMAGELEQKLDARVREYTCTICGTEGLKYTGRGRTPQICPVCRPAYDKEYQRKYAERTRRATGGPHRWRGNVRP